MKSGYLMIFVLGFITYIVFVGSISIYDIMTGIIVSILASLIFTKYLIKNHHKLFELNRLINLLKYVFIFTKQEIQSHIEIVKIIISKKVNPGIIEIPYELESSYAITLTACSITNTPGTLVVDIDSKEKKFYVHWIDMKTLNINEAKKLVSKAFEELSKKIFD